MEIEGKFGEHSPGSLDKPSLRAKCSSTTSRNYTNALILNKKADAMLCELENQLLEKLNICQKKIEKVRFFISYCESNPSGDGKSAYFSYYQCGIPYFKDHDLFPSPPNADVKKMTLAGITNYFHNSIKNAWTPHQKKVLEFEIMKQAKEKKRKQLTLKIKKLEIENSKMKSEKFEIDNKIEVKDNLRALSTAMDDLKLLQVQPLSDIVLPLEDNEEFDWDYIETQGEVGHKACECRSMWRMFLHPEINKKAWTHGEERHLSELVLQQRHQNWEAIARHLNTGRTSYQCFLFYRHRLARKSLRSVHWTPAEDEYLISVVESCRIGDFIPWAKVAYHVENRTKEQIYHRWVHQLAINRRGRFSVEEDNVIMAAVREYGCHFKRIAELLPGRSAVQVRVRYRALDYYKNHSYIQWTFAEDRLLLNLVTQSRYHSDNIDFISLSKQFSNKPPNSVRIRFRTLENWLLKHPHKGLAQAPRRKILIQHNLNNALSLSDAIKKLQSEPKKTKKTTKKRTPGTAPQQLYSQFVDYFKNTAASSISKPPERVTPAEVNISELKTVLLFLGAKLDKKLIHSELFNLEHPELKKIAENLLNSENEISVPYKFKSVRTYSRKKADIATPSLSASPLSTSPTIWKESSEVDSQRISNSYVLPPFHNSILAFKTLMLQKFSLGETLPREYMDYQVKTKFDSNFSVWRCRFETLFTWPANLSNIPPRIKTNIFEENKNVQISCKPSFVEDGEVKSLDDLLKENNTFPAAGTSSQEQKQGRSRLNKNTLKESTETITINESLSSVKRNKILSKIPNSGISATTISKANHTNIPKNKKRKIVENSPCTSIIGKNKKKSVSKPSNSKYHKKNECEHTFFKSAKDNLGSTVVVQ